MPVDAISTLIILVCMLALLITEWVPPGITGLLTIAALALSGVLPSTAAFDGMRNTAVITVACMFVLSAAVERTGAAAVIADRVIRKSKKRTPLGAYIGLLAITMLLSGFVNNTPLVLIFMPLVLGLADKIGEPPSRLLIPLSFVSILGGACTLVGTSTNLIVAYSLTEASGGTMQIRMFDFAPLGVILAIAGGLTILLFRRRLLPIRASLDLVTKRGVAVEYVTELEIRAGSRLVGKTLSTIEKEKLLAEELNVLQVVRGEVIRLPRPEVELREGDLLLVRGSPEAVLELRRLEEEQAKGPESVRKVALMLFEIVVTPDSHWRGRLISELALHDRYQASVFALQRHGAHLREKIGHLRLQAGDVLLVQGAAEAIERLRASGNVLVVEGVDRIARKATHVPHALFAMALFIVLAVSEVVPTDVAALTAALAAVLTGCISARDAYQSIGWDVIFLVAGTLALGGAFESTGLAANTAQAVVDMTSRYGIHMVLGSLLVFTMLLTQVLSNNATAAIMTPLAYELGIALDSGNPLPFVMAVAFGANCSFLTPVSYNTNLIVYGPGGYQFRDFLRPGLPLTVLYLVLAGVLLPILY